MDQLRHPSLTFTPETSILGDIMDNTSYHVPAKKSKKPYGGIMVAIFVFLLLAFTIGMIFGQQRALRAAVPEGEGHVLGQGEIPAHLEGDIDFKQFWDVWNFMKETYYRQPVSEKELFYGALKGMLAAAEDPYTVYFDPEEADMFNANLEGSFEGIGAEIGIKEEQLQIVAPLPGTPAEQAGLRPGDHIVMIDEVDTFGMTIEEAVSRIRGEKGSTVTLAISREGIEGLVDVPIKRDKIVVDSVRSEMGEDGIMYISIFTFNGDTNELFNRAVNEALTGGATGIILDLRSNPGGLLTSAIDIAAAWVGYDTVVIEKKQDKQDVFAGMMAPRLQDIPTVVLVDGGSASGSEIVAGALQDYGYATLVGTQTFGKGSVQDYRELADGSAVKITVAEWFTPNGRTINQTGITPDVEVEFTLEDANEERDPQKEKAYEILTGQSAE